MKNTLKVAIKSILAGAVFVAGSASAGTVSSAVRAFDGGASSIGNVGDTLIATNQSTSAHSYTDNAALNYSAWGHAGRWYNFEVTSTVDTKIQVAADNAADWAPAFTVYRTDGVWGEGTATFTETGITGNTPHNFNATGNIGDNGTLWMQQGAAGNTADSNALATLGYSNSGAMHHAGQTNWGEHIHTGFTAKDGAAIYTSGASGAVAQGYAEMTLSDLSTGWYTIYVGGADSTLSNSPYSVNVSAVPVPAAIYLFGSALVGVVAARRKAVTA